MQYTLVKGLQSNFEVQITLTEVEMTQLSEKTLKSFQKDVDSPGFRKGFVPLHMVKELIKPGYLEMGMLEELVHTMISKVLDEHKDKQFIGQPYDFNPMQLKTAEKGVYTVTFKLDVYPEPVEKDKKWLKIPMTKLSVEISDDKKKSVVATIKKQYADYQDVTDIAEDTVSKIKVTYGDNDHKELQSRTVYVGDDEFVKDALATKVFVGMKKDATVEKKYDEKALPSFVHFTGDSKPTYITFEVKDCKKVVLPEFTDSFIKEKFGDSGISNEKELLEQIEKTLKATHEQEDLQKKIDDYVSDAMSSFDVMIPETFLQEEMKHRFKHLEKQLGGESGLRKFLDNMGEDKSKSYLEEMRQSAQKSLEKFLLLKKLVEEHGLDSVDWNNQLDAEKKLYNKLTGDNYFESELDVAKSTTKTAKKSTKKSD